VRSPFTSREITLGADQFGEPVTTLVIDWAPEAARATPGKDKGWPKSLRLLQRAMMAVLADQGTDQRPFPDGPIVRAIELQVVRSEFYKSYPADGDAKQQQEARRKAFNRAIHDAQANSVIGVRIVDGTTLVWLVGRDATA
jgi:hypothetical protein